MNFETLFTFVRENLLLVIAFFFVVIAIIFEENRGRLRKTKTVSASSLAMLLNRDNVVVLDIRDHASFQKEHILSSINVPYKSDMDGIKNKLQQHKNKHIVVVDNVDNNSFKVVPLLKVEGFEEISVLSGGIMAWKNASLPLKGTSRN